MNDNFKLSEQVAIVATLDPSSQAVSTATSTWVPVANFHRFAALVDIGAVGGAGTVAVAFLQATSSGGAGSKAVVNQVTGANVVTSAPVAVSNSQVMLEALADWVDSTNGYGYVAITITVAGNAVLTQGTLFGHAPRFGPANLLNQAGVAQVI